MTLEKYYLEKYFFMHVYSPEWSRDSRFPQQKWQRMKIPNIKLIVQ
jgi:hypothetical protein